MNKIIYFALIISLLISCKKSIKEDSDFDSQNSEIHSTYNQSPQSKKEWYEGGTLHRATVAEWKKASARNKLATCGDFITSITESKSTPIEEIKREAKNLRTCINEAVKGSKYTDEYKVSRIAAICTSLMK